MQWKLLEHLIFKKKNKTLLFSLDSLSFSGPKFSSSVLGRREVLPDPVRAVYQDSSYLTDHKINTQ
jgi:hypothetical protein